MSDERFESLAVRVAVAVIAITFLAAHIHNMINP